MEVWLSHLSFFVDPGWDGGRGRSLPEADPVVWLERRFCLGSYGPALSREEVLMDYALVGHALETYHYNLNEVLAAAYESGVIREISKVGADQIEGRCTEVISAWQTAIQFAIAACTAPRAQTQLTLPSRFDVIKYIEDHEIDITSFEGPGEGRLHEVKLLLPDWAAPQEIVTRSVIQARARIDSLATPDDGPRRQQEISLLSQLAIWLAQADLLREAAANAVLLARDARVPWREIGIASGISEQAAHRRWTPASKERHRQYQRARYRPAREGSAPSTDDNSPDDGAN